MTTTIHNLTERDRKLRGQLIRGKVHTGHHAELTPHASIRLFGIETNRHGGPLAYDRTFRVGDRCEIDSYNLRYLGTIVDIAPSYVAIRDDLGGKVKRMALPEFSWRNRDFDLPKVEAFNAEDMRCI
jgi:hypothetical protein